MVQGGIWLRLPTQDVPGPSLDPLACHPDVLRVWWAPQAGPAKAIKFTSIPIGAAIGFVGTPVASPVVRAAGAFIAGTAAKFANDRIRSVSTYLPLLVCMIE